MVSLWSLGADLEHLEGDLGRLRELGEHQVAQREAKGSPKLKSLVQKGLTRADKGMGRRHVVGRWGRGELKLAPYSWN